MNREYVEFVTELKQRIGSARLHAARAVNQDLILLYWDIGRGIVERQEKLGWGQSVVEMLSRDLRKAFPEMKGFSAANLWRMRQFYSACATPEFLAQAVRELIATTPWGHHVELLNKVKDPPAYIYYLRVAAKLGGSRYGASPLIPNQLPVTVILPT